MKNQKSNSVFKIKAQHEDLTQEITNLCLKRYLKRIKAQIKHTEVGYPEHLTNLLQEYKIIKKALSIINFYH